MAPDPLELVTNAYELCCGSWELNPDPLQEQPVFLSTVSSAPVYITYVMLLSYSVTM